VRVVMRNNLLPVAKEGLPYVVYGIIAILVFSLLDFEFFAFLTGVAILFIIYVFRNPERELMNYENNSVVAVCDGVVKSIEAVEGKEYAYKIEIESSYLNISLLRAPFHAHVESLKVTKGTRASSQSKLFKDLNENSTIIFRNDSNNSVKVVHRVKQSFAPLFVDLIPEQSLQQTARYGLMVTGVTTLYLPANFRVNVKVGNELKASETLVGYFS